MSQGKVAGRYIIQCQKRAAQTGDTLVRSEKELAAGTPGEGIESRRKRQVGSPETLMRQHQNPVWLGHTEQEKVIEMSIRAEL